MCANTLKNLKSTSLQDILYLNVFMRYCVLKLCSINSFYNFQLRTVISPSLVIFPFALSPCVKPSGADSIPAPSIRSYDFDLPSDSLVNALQMPFASWPSLLQIATSPHYGFFHSLKYAQKLPFHDLEFSLIDKTDFSCGVFVVV